MPSPIGHSLIGCATGVLLLTPRGSIRRMVRETWRLRWWLFACAAAANAPDIDFVPGLLAGDFNAFHHGPSHSLVWASMAAIATGALADAFRPGRGLQVAGIAFLLIAGHLAADFVCQDFLPPFGIMPFWPLDTTYRIAPWSVFFAMDKATLAEVFTRANLRPAWRELWVGTLCIVTAFATRFRRPA